MTDHATMRVGPLGSVIHVLRADARTVEQLATIDWSRRFRRVCLDPVRGLVTLMSPSRLHEDLSEIFDDIVDVAADVLGQASNRLRSTRLRGRGEPPGTGMEPDCSFAGASPDEEDPRAGTRAGPSGDGGPRPQS